MISTVSAKLIADKARDKKPGNVWKRVVVTAIRKAIQRLMVKLTADLCADKRNISTMNMQTPAKEISCSGRCLVSTTSQATSKPKTAKMKSLKVQLEHEFTLMPSLATLRLSPPTTWVSLTIWSICNGAWRLGPRVGTLSWLFLPSAYWPLRRTQRQQPDMLGPQGQGPSGSPVHRLRWSTQCNLQSTRGSVSNKNQSLGSGHKQSKQLVEWTATDCQWSTHEQKLHVTCSKNAQHNAFEGLGVGLDVIPCSI